MNTANPTGLRRFSTGIAELDQMLGGGVPAYSVIVLAGEPGTGKSILSQQMLFSGAAAGRKGLYLSTLSESPLKSARYQSEFDFFDPERFGDSVVYMDVGETIRRQSLAKAVDVITAALGEHQPQVVVVDSFKAIHDMAQSAREVRTFAYDLAVELSAIQATTFLVGEYEAEDIGRAPEFAVADGIVWLTLERHEGGARRFLRILKMRGVNHQTVPVSFEITRSGIRLYALPSLVPASGRRLGRPLSSGVPALDDLLRGGIPHATTMLVSGEAGAGKTTFGLQFLMAGARSGQKCLYFSYEQPVEELIASARTFGWDLEPQLQSGALQIAYTPLPLVNPDREVLRILAAVDGQGIDRVVIDSLTMLMHGIDRPEVVRRYVYSLITLLGNAGVTALINTDPPAGSGLISRFGVEESLVDSVLVFRTRTESRERKRYVEVHKLRGANHASGESLMRIGKAGIAVFPRSEEATR